MNKELSDLLKTIPKERYEEILKNADDDFDIQKFVELIRAEGVELTEDKVQLLEAELEKKAQENEGRLSADQMDNVSGGLNFNLVKALLKIFGEY